MQTSDQIKSQIQSLLTNHPEISVDVLFLYVPEFKILHQFLDENETIKGYCIGLLEGKQKKYTAGKWLLVLTKKQIHLLRNPMLGNPTHIPIDFAELQNTSTKLGWFFGQIHLETETETFRLIQIGKKDFQFFLPSLQSYLK
ncbi:Hypothetical protein LBF_3057 [Leptospira biflexa serovar Patoc strain 'Patoc 1 (Ames)']|uniref:YokE-like PH domain-containing protein n=1 Tax=Leptospira biflexa serovar Patoc (strain Patoc 1 / ATCC 23582 / Paris) TaxID=456481 RepID=B0SQ80_LEPBP|nr:PH domain-containing protein [Leptospira biflexa]ABZ95526.1 Hypothetical protein LBF_3057 [Leptospira biflexa serovar Patoc strain 'Patoc 1 (Ames)']ABZ99232.1 Hypothetical protein LEPBI_I3167 [Leptospira biflexa serovar Patoc strain 'Patoc 1 (Paris)']